MTRSTAPAPARIAAAVLEPFPAPDCVGGIPCTAAARIAAAVVEPRFVASASRNELFVIASGVVAIDLRTGERRTIDTGDVSLGSILAATYDVLSDRLYMLDEIARPHGRGRTDARLVAIDPEGGAMVLGTWRRAAATSRFAMGAAQDGRLYVAASGDRGAHVLVAISLDHDRTSHGRPRDTLSARGIGVGSGPLGSDVVYASRYEVSFVAEPRAGARVVSYRPDEARFRSGDCMTDVF